MNTEKLLKEVNKIPQIESSLDSIANVISNINEFNSKINTKNNLIIKNNTYEYTDSIDIRSGFFLKGESLSGVILKPIGNIVPFINRDSNISYSTIYIENLTIDCSQCTTTVGGLSILKSKNIKLRNIIIKNLSNSTGVYINESGNVELDNVIVDGCKYGIGLFNSKKVILNNCEANNNKWDGFITNFLQDSEFNNCYADHNGYDCGVGNTACGFYIAYGSENVVLNNPSSKDNSGRGIEIDRSYNCKVYSPKTRGDKTGIKLIGSIELQGNTGSHLINNVDIESIGIPISTSNSIGNIINSGCAKGNGTHLIFDDGTSGSNINSFLNIKLYGTYTTDIINSNIGNKSKFENITFNTAIVKKINNQIVFIDFVNGNDNNNGETITTPIKTIFRLSKILNMTGQDVEIKIIGVTVGFNSTDWTYIGDIKGSGKLIFNFEGKSIELNSTTAIGSSDKINNIMLIFKDATFLNTVVRAIYIYRQDIVFENINATSNLSVECLANTNLICKNCNITPIMKYDNSSSIVKDRWDSTSVIHTSLLNLSPS